MLRAERTSLWPARYAINDDGGRRFATWSPAVLTPGGRLRVDGTSYRMRRAFLRSTTTLEDGGGRMLATMRRTRKGGWELEVADTTYDLRPASASARRLELTEAGAVLGHVQRLGALRTSAEANLPSLSPLLQSFLLAALVNAWTGGDIAAGALPD